MENLVKRSSRVLIDVLVLATAFALAVTLRYEGDIPADILRRTVTMLPYIVALQYLGLMAFAVPRFSWRYVGLREVTRIALALAASGALLLVARFASVAWMESFPRIRYAWFPVGVVLIDYLLVLLGLTGIRAIRRLVGEHSDALRHARAADRVPTMLIGAGEAGLAVAKEIMRRRDLAFEPVGFLDDDRAKVGTILHGIPVLGTTDELAPLAAKAGAREVLITIAAASGQQIRRIAGLCEDANLRAKIIPSLSEFVGGRLSLNRIRSVAIEDLLRRDPVDLDETAITGAVGGRVVLVTGAGGSIGAELCRQVCKFAPMRLVLAELSENNLFHIHRELHLDYPGVDIVPCLVDVGDRARMQRLFRRYPVDLVFHAAAHKHVPMMEWNPEQAVRNNVRGTLTVAELAAAPESGVQAFVLVSTDKAVRPSSVMGASKRVAELIVQGLAARSTTRFVAVRFGNVLGSAGSVVPLFKQQIAAGGPITVTDPEMTRYFMTIPEACQLVLQAGTMGRGGEIFILDMGQPVKIVDLARDLIHLSGLRAEEDIEIVFTGVRPGEKLVEVLSSMTSLDDTTHPNIMVERGEPPPWEPLRARIEVLVAACGDASASGREIRDRLGELVPEYAPSETSSVLDGEPVAPAKPAAASATPAPQLGELRP